MLRKRAVQSKKVKLIFDGKVDETELRLLREHHYIGVVRFEVVYLRIESFKLGH